MDRLSQVPRATKLLFTLFNGGKAAGSLVKYSKFYLIVDGNAIQRCNSSSSPDFVDRTRPNLLQAFQKFTVALKKAVSSGKTGESAFKPNEEGAYFNAFPSGLETLKQIEDAIAQCGINGEDAVRPSTSA